MTGYQDSVICDIRRETKARKDAYIAQFGSRFIDVIIESPDKHGRGKVGFACEFGGRQTYGSGETIQGFARKAFGTGMLRNIGPMEHWNNEGTRYVVLAAE